MNILLFIIFYSTFKKKEKKKKIERVQTESELKFKKSTSKKSCSLKRGISRVFHFPYKIFVGANELKNKSETD